MWCIRIVVAQRKLPVVVSTPKEKKKKRMVLSYTHTLLVYRVSLGGGGGLVSQHAQMYKYIAQGP